MAKKVSELKPTNEVVVTLGAKQDSKNGKLINVEKERDVVMPLSGFEAIAKDTDDEGHSKALGRTVVLKGIPKYKKSEESMAGSHREIESVEEFAPETALAPIV